MLTKKDSATSQFNQPIWKIMIEEMEFYAMVLWELRDGCFDGLYFWNDIRSTRYGHVTLNTI